MSTNDWTELTRLWQSDVPAAAPALEVIERQKRHAWAWRVTWISEVVATILGIVASVWVMTADKPHGLIIGSGMLALTVLAAGASLWARSLRRSPAPDVSVLASLEAALHRARVSVRWGFSTFWVNVGYFLFIAMMLFVTAFGEQRPDALRKMLVVLGVGAIWGAICQAIAVVYYQARMRELARLEELKRALDDGAP
jgi:hypothetical protein